MIWKLLRRNLSIWLWFCQSDILPQKVSLLLEITLDYLSMKDTKKYLCKLSTKYLYCRSNNNPQIIYYLISTKMKFYCNWLFLLKKTNYIICITLQWVIISRWNNVCVSIRLIIFIDWSHGTYIQGILLTLVLICRAIQILDFGF